MYTNIVTSPAAASEALRPMPAMATVLRIGLGFCLHDIDDKDASSEETDESLSSALTAFPTPLALSLEPLPLLVEFASAVAMADAACAPPG